MADEYPAYPEPDVSWRGWPHIPLTALDWDRGSIASLLAATVLLNAAQALLITTTPVRDLPADRLQVVRYVAVIAYYALLLGAIVLAARRKGVAVRDALGLRPIGAAPVALAVMAVFAVRWAAAAYALIVQALKLNLPGQDVDITKIFGFTTLGFIATLVLAGVVGPFVEEAVFRAVTMSSIRDRYGNFWAIVGSAFLFALVHVNLYNFLPLLMVGVVFAWLFIATRSLWTSIVAHSLFNMVAVVALYVLKSSGRV